MTIDAAFIHFPSLSTNRFFLRHIQPTDAEDLFVTFSDEEAMQFYGHEPHRCTGYLVYLFQKSGRRQSYKNHIITCLVSR